MVKDIQELARQQAPEAIEALVRNLMDENGAVRNTAAVALLDRGYGKPTQTVNSNVTTDVRRLSDDQLDGAIARVLAALERGEAAEEPAGLTH